jgi:hypothetical protein
MIEELKELCPKRSVDSELVIEGRDPDGRIDGKIIQCIFAWEFGGQRSESVHVGDLWMTEMAHRDDTQAINTLLRDLKSWFQDETGSVLKIRKEGTILGNVG